MEAGSHSGIARLVQPSLGTNALFLSYVFVDIRYYTTHHNIQGIKHLKSNSQRFHT
jgi:hypothetical protein